MGEPELAATRRFPDGRTSGFFIRQHRFQNGSHADRDKADAGELGEKCAVRQHIGEPGAEEEQNRKRGALGNAKIDPIKGAACHTNGAIEQGATENGYRDQGGNGEEGRIGSV